MALTINHFNDVFIYRNSLLQKIFSTPFHEIVFHFYHHEKKSFQFIFDLKNESSCFRPLAEKMQSSPKPNSIIQVAKKYFLNKKVLNVSKNNQGNFFAIEFDVSEKDSPTHLIFDLTPMHRRVCVSRFHFSVPLRYQNEKNLSLHSSYESFCEWSLENIKTKRRLFSNECMEEFCPLFGESNQDLENKVTVITQNNQKLQGQEESFDFHNFPTNIRKIMKNKIDFFHRKIQKIEDDFQSTLEIDRLKKEAQGLLLLLSLWGPHKNSQETPFDLQQEYGLQKIYSVKLSEKPSCLLDNIYIKIDKLKNRKIQSEKRLSETKKHLENFMKLISRSILEIQEHNSSNTLGVEKSIYFLLNSKTMNATKELFQKLEISKKIETNKKNEDVVRLPYREVILKSKIVIRISKNAVDADQMIKLMPSHHYWLHIFNHEGSHVWIVLNKKINKLPDDLMRQASILAIHYSKMSKSMSGDVQVAKRQDVEKRKHLLPGKVFVKKAEINFIKYSKIELDNLINREDKI